MENLMWRPLMGKAEREELISKNDADARWMNHIVIKLSIDTRCDQSKSK